MLSPSNNTISENVFRAHNDLQLVTLEWKTVQLPLKLSIHHAGAQRDFIESVIVWATFDKGIGNAEVRANGSYATGEDLKTILVGLEAASELLQDGQISLMKILAKIAPLSTLATMVLEVSGWDALSKSEGLPLSQYLSGKNTAREILTHSQIPFGTVEDMKNIAQSQRLLGVKEVKVRVGGPSLDLDVERLKVCRSIFGAEVEIIPDVNGGWSEEKFDEFCARTLDINLNWIEQPIFALEELGKNKELHGELGVGRSTPNIIADESARTLEQIQYLGSQQLAQGIHLKLEKFGTLQKLIQAKELTESFGMTPFFGQMDQGMLGCSATCHLAIALGFQVAEVYGYADIKEDVAEGLSFRDGAVITNTAAGLGIQLKF